MEILSESKRILSYAGLGKSAHILIGNKVIPRIVIRGIILFTLGLAILLHVFLCIKDYKHGLTAISVPLGATLTCLSIILIYGSLISKTEQIIRLFNYLHQVIRKSMIFCVGVCTVLKSHREEKMNSSRLFDCLC